MVPLSQQNALSKLQQQPSALIWWERFLPIRTLKVLLVESDDSTRHIVSALLRKCSYEVTAVSNSLDAWKILMDLTNHIDLILNEVVMPYLSGIGLLAKIMNHKTCKNIPVIMMSSNDSIGIVFECLSKGAVDFLVKPVRKNELKNLWQHVWKRCHSSGGSGSGSGIQNLISAKPKSGDSSYNKCGSNDEDDDGSIGLNGRDCSDNGSGIQDSSCAQIIHPKPAYFSDNAKVNTATVLKEHKDLSDDIMGKDLEIGPPRNVGLNNESCQNEKGLTELSGPTMNKNNDGASGLEYSNNINEPKAKTLDLIAAIANLKPLLGLPEMKEKFKESSMELPSLQLSLKRLRSTRDVGLFMNDGCRALKRSAFSRYPTSVASAQEPAEHGISSVLGNSFMEPQLKQCSDGSSDTIVGSTNKPVACKKTSKFSIKCNRPSSAFHSVLPQNPTIGDPKQVQVQHRYHRHHHVLAMQTSVDDVDDDLTHKNLKNIASCCSSTKMSEEPADVNGSNFSLNGSNSESNHGSDPQDGCNPCLSTEVMSMDGGAVIAKKSGVDGGSRFSQRQTALNKFRQKRKARNFDKKVRYQSRKRLAEQRPRVRGQFVRRANYDNKSQQES